MKPTLASRIGRRARDEFWRLRLRAGTAVAGGTSFEYWGRWSDRAHSELQDVPPNEEFISRGTRQLAFLKSLGLTKDDMILDYGCAILRTASFLVPFLEPGRYVGADVGMQVMRRGALMLEKSGIERNRYHLVVVHGPGLDELDGFRFKFIFSDSVLQYLSDADFLSVVRGFRRLIADNGVVYASFPDESALAALKAKGNYFRDRERTRQLCADAGFAVEMLEAGKSGYPASPYVLLRPGA